MSYRCFFISVTASVLLFSFSARSQETPPGRGADESAAAAVRKKAIDLLESLAGQVDSLHSAENRARIGSNVAELLWNYNEKRSRSLFAAIEEDIKAGFNDTDPDDGAHNHTLMVFGQLRGDILGRIAKHDPELALEFLWATRPASDMELPYEMRDGEKSLESSLAVQIAAKNPQLALKLGLQSLAKGFSTHLLSVLSQLQRKDKEAALSLYGAIVDKLKSANLARNPTATELALNLARSFQPPEADEQVYRDLIGIVLENALANGCANATYEHNYYLCSQIGPIFSKMEKYYAPQAAGLRRWALDGQSGEDKRVAVFQQVYEIIEKGTIEEILALAPKYPEMQGEIYWQAVMKAESSGDIARARQIASDIPDEEERRSLLAQIDRDQKWRSMSDERLAELQQLLSSFRRPEERIRFLLQVANQMGSNDRKAVLGLLNQAGELISSTKPGAEQMEEQIRLATLYCSLKSDRGFAIMESVLPKLNELVSAAAALDGFENNYLRDGEWTMTSAGSIGTLLTGLAQKAGYFGRLDFDRSVTLANQFERPELRLMAQLKIAQGVLASQPNPGPAGQTTVKIH
ncbi:MAG TPA: hypothetical protein VGJ55_15535 [Pyrinomonadaceae bacterium]